MNASIPPLVPINPREMNGAGSIWGTACSPEGMAPTSLSQGTVGALPLPATVKSFSIRSTPHALNQAPVHTTQEMQKVSKQFEAIFLQMMLQQMRKTVDADPLLGKSNAMDIFQSMQDEQYAGRLSEKGMGLGNMVYRQLLTDTLHRQQRVGGAGL